MRTLLYFKEHLITENITLKTIQIYCIQGFCCILAPLRFWTVFLVIYFLCIILIQICKLKAAQYSTQDWVKGVSLCLTYTNCRIIHSFFNVTKDWTSLKGQCHEIFDFWLFSWISFHQAPEYTKRVVTNLFENSRRYSQLKVCHRCQRHRWQMKKIFNHKSFYYLVWTPLGSIVNL